MNIASINSFLEEQFGDELAAAFIYGSVASGRAHPGSDIDFFVITVRELTPGRRHRTAVRFAELQRGLGFTPDPDYPVEIFSVAACESLLAGVVLDAALRNTLLTGAIDPSLIESDDIEVLCALLDRRLVLRRGPVLDQLTSQAQELLDRHTDDVAQLRRALKLTEDAR